MLGKIDSAVDLLVDADIGFFRGRVLNSHLIVVNDTGNDVIVLTSKR